MRIFRLASAGLSILVAIAFAIRVVPSAAITAVENDGLISVEGNVRDDLHLMRANPRRLRTVRVNHVLWYDCVVCHL